MSFDNVVASGMQRGTKEGQRRDRPPSVAICAQDLRSEPFGPQEAEEVMATAANEFANATIYCGCAGCSACYTDRRYIAKSNEFTGAGRCWMPPRKGGADQVKAGTRSHSDALCKSCADLQEAAARSGGPDPAAVLGRPAAVVASQAVPAYVSFYDGAVRHAEAAAAASSTPLTKTEKERLDELEETVEQLRLRISVLECDMDSAMGRASMK